MVSISRIAFTVTTALAGLTKANPISTHELVPRYNANDGFNTRCPHDPKVHFDPNTFSKVMTTYANAYGGGGGMLNAGMGGAPTYQGVCCEGWCIYVERHYLDKDFAWNDEQFHEAAARLKEHGSGRGACTTDLDKGKLKLTFTPDTSKIWIRTDSNGGENVKLIDEMGDTCRGAKPYRGPN